MLNLQELRLSEVICFGEPVKRIGVLNLLGTAIPTPTGNGGCRDQGKLPATPRMCHPSPLQDHPRSIYLPSSIIPSGISPPEPQRAEIT